MKPKISSVNMSNKSALIVFAREPKDGKVKTRLCRDLPFPIVTRLYKAFVKDVLKTALETKCDKRFIYYAGHGASIPFLRRYMNDFQLKRQMGKDLGERMHAALMYCQKNHFNKIVIIGTDCLTLTKRDIECALKKLDFYDVVLGPSKDGGYYLIALKSSTSKLFKGIRWSTSSVLKQTLQKARQMRKRIFLLRKLEDIDTIEHLEGFHRSAKGNKVAVQTRKTLNDLVYAS